MPLIHPFHEGRCFSKSDIAWAKKWAANLKAGVEAIEVSQTLGGDSLGRYA